MVTEKVFNGKTTIFNYHFFQAEEKYFATKTCLNDYLDHLESSAYESESR